MPMATSTNASARGQKSALATAFNEMAMISADRIRSVVMAPRTIWSSRFTPMSTTGDACSVLCLCSPVTYSSSFSAPSKLR